MGSGGGTAFAVPLSDAELQTLASQIQQINNTSDSATASETPAAQADATEGWTIDSNIAKGGEILETVDGWLHFKSTEAHGNAASNPSSSNDWPAVAVLGHRITTSPRPAPSTPPSSPRRKAPPTASAST